MKNGADLSVVLAPGGTAMFWVTQAGCAKRNRRKGDEGNQRPRED